MPWDLWVRVKRQPKEAPVSFEEILARPGFSAEDINRLRSCLSHERLARAAYHHRRYLRHLSEDELYSRIGYLIANVIFVSSRNRYSANNRYLNYWRDRLAHTAEELAIRNCTQPFDDNVVRHLPSLGFSTPKEPALRHDPRRDVFYRYDRLKYLRKLQAEGEIYLRCASTQGPTIDVARADANEMCLNLKLLSNDLELTSPSPDLSSKDWLKTINFKIFQRTDFYMFCLSQVYDWRLFGDFNAGAPSDDPADQIACLVITEPDEFARRFSVASVRFKTDRDKNLAYPLKPSAQSAIYYDAYDSQECAPLFDDRSIMPFAKRREFTYQHEFRFVLRPDLPDGFIPPCAPTEIPKFERDYLHLGGIEDISYVIQPSSRQREEHKYYLSNKNAGLLASAIGVTLPASQQTIRFTYSVESKEKGRTDPRNLVVPERFGGHSSLQLHEQQIDIPTNGGPAALLQAISDFYSVFDIREQGNHLISFDATDRASSLYEYRAYLPCAEPPDEQIAPFPLVFEFVYTATKEGRALQEAVQIRIDGHAYWASFNGVGPLHLHPTYRSLLIAEMEFLHRLMHEGVTDLLSYETRSMNMVYRCSELKKSDG